MHRSRWRLAIAAFVTLTVCAAALLVLNLRPPRGTRLLDRATRVAATRGWAAAGLIEDRVRYFWLNDDAVLRFSGNTRKGYQAIHVAIETGQETPLPIRTRPMHTGSDSRWIGMSPDRNWLLWTDEREWGIGGDENVAAAIDGSGRRLTWPHRGGNVTWMQDNNRWIALTGPERKNLLLIHRTDKPKEVRVLTPSVTKRQPWFLAFTPEGQALALDIGAMLKKRMVHNYGAGADYVVIDYAAWKTAATIDLFKFDVVTEEKQPDSPLISFSVPMPPGTDRVLVLPAPRGDRIAWLVRSPRRLSSPLLGLLSRLFPAFFEDPQPSVNLWVSRNDGTEMRNLGYLHPKGPNLFASPPQWTPSGKRLSFLYKGALWTVPTD